MPGNHAFLSPSSAVRWLFCPPSARLCEQFPDQGSIYASEGTEAHALCEHLLKEMLGLPTVDPRPSMQYYDGEMEECCQAYAQFICEKVEAHRREANGAEPYVFVEQGLDLRKYIPESMGTADCVIVSGETIEVIDFKYGKHPVTAQSPQIRIYAIGAYEMFSPLYPISRVRMGIFQPRIANVAEMELSVEELLSWGENELAPRAREAFDGVGAFACGDWCRICRARQKCRALADYQLAIEQYEMKDPALLSDAEIADILSRADDLVSWVNAVKEFALQEALSGHQFPGFKVVEGRANRKYIDEDAVAARVKAEGKDPWDQSIKGITAMQKLLGKKHFEELLSDLLSRPEGKPTLVPVTDKRPELTPARVVFTPVDSDSAT